MMCRYTPSPSLTTVAVTIVIVKHRQSDENNDSSNGFDDVMKNDKYSENKPCSKCIWYCKNHWYCILKAHYCLVF